jgi:hypothetical protein
MRPLVLLVALVAAACGDNRPATRGDDATILGLHVSAMLSQCGLDTADADAFRDRFCSTTDCDEVSTMDLGACLDAIDATACTFIGFPEDCPTCGFVAVPDACRVLWLTAP